MSESTSVIRDVAVYGVGDVVVKATTLLALPMYTRTLSLGQYGELTALLALVSLAVAAVSLGGESAYARFFLATEAVEERRTVTSTWIGFLAVWSATLALALLPGAQLLSEWLFGTAERADAVVVGILSIPVILLSRMCAQVLRNQFRPFSFVTLNVLGSFGGVGAAFVLGVVLDLGVVGFLGGILIAEAALLPVRLYVSRDMFGRPCSRLVLRRLLSYGVPLVPASIAYWAVAAADRLLMAKLSTLRELGLYGVAVGVSGVLLLVNGAIGQAWSPHAIRIYEQQPKEAPAIFGRALTTILAGMGLLCVAATTFAPELVRLLATPSYLSAERAVGPLALAMIALASTHVTAAGISLTGNTRPIAKFSVAAAGLNVVLCVLLIPQLGMMGAAWATAASYAFLTGAYVVVSRRLWRVEYEMSRTLKLSLLIVGFTLCSRLVPSSTTSGSMAARAAYCMVFVAAMFATGAIDGREFGMVRKVFARG